jgi:hypothetical protein
MVPTPSRSIATRLRIFVDRGLIPVLPTRWQLIQGEAEMAPYVVAPDAGDQRRYAGAPLGHPVLRQTIVFTCLGPEHLRIGSGFHTSFEVLVKHLMFVHHEGMPAYDLQLVHSVPGGLDALRRYAREIEAGATPLRRLQRRLIDLIIPDPSGYRNRFLAPGGWIDRAKRFDYPRGEELPSFLRPEWTSLVAFANYCTSRFDKTAAGMGPLGVARHLARLATTVLRDQRASP